MPRSVHCQVGKIGKMGTIKATTSTPVDISALTLEYDKKDNVYIARGQVEIKEGLRKLTADFVRYNKETGDVYAEGNVIFQEQGDVVNSEKMYLNLVDKKGTIEKGKIFIGTTVKLKETESGDEYTYTIVDVEEASAAESKISVQSPMAQGLLGHKPGDVVKVQLPGGVTEFKVLKIS